MNAQRQRRIDELNADAVRRLDEAEALDLLAARIAHGSIPVERWRAIWISVADDTRARARALRRAARADAEHAGTLERANDARLIFERTR